MWAVITSFLLPPPDDVTWVSVVAAGVLGRCLQGRYIPWRDEKWLSLDVFLSG